MLRTTKVKRKAVTVVVLAFITLFLVGLTGETSKDVYADSQGSFTLSVKNMTGQKSVEWGSMWNGDLKKVRLEIVENHGLFTCPVETDGNTNKIIRTEQRGYILDSAGDLITMYEYNESRPYEIHLNMCPYNYRYKGGKVHIKVYYDGKHIFTSEQIIEADSYAANALALAKRIVGSGSGSWTQDKDLIKTTLKKKYSQTDMPCGRGAAVLQNWCAHKYHIYGSINDAIGASSHVEFYPDPTKISGGPFGADGDAPKTAAGWPVW